MATDSDQYINYYVEDYIAADYYEQELYFAGDYLESGYFEGEQVVVEAAAVLAVSAAVSVQTTVLVPASADLQTNATQSTTPTRILEFTADFDALFSPTVLTTALKNHDALLEVDANLTTAAELIADIDKTLESIVNLNLQAAKFTGIVETLPATALLSADYDRIRAATAQLDSEHAVTADLQRTRTSTAQLGAIFTQDTISGQIVTAESNAAATTELLTDSTRTRQTAANISAESTVFCQIKRIFDLSAEFESLLTPEITVSALKNHTATLEPEFTLSTGVERTRQTAANFNNTASISADIDRLRSTDSSISAVFSTQILANFRLFESDISANSTLNCETAVTRTTAVDLSQDFTVSLEERFVKGRAWGAIRSIHPLKPYPDSDGPIVDFRTFDLSGFSGSQYLSNKNLPDFGLREGAFGNLRYFSGGSVRVWNVRRTSGVANTNINTNDFVFDFYFSPSGISRRDDNFNYVGDPGFTIVSFPDSDNETRIAYKYFNDDTSERMTFELVENSAPTQSVDITPVTNITNKNYNDETRTPFYNGWIFFRLQRINGVLTLKYRDLTASLPSTVNTAFTTTDNSNYGSGYQIWREAATDLATGNYEDDPYDSFVSGFNPSQYIDNIMLQITDSEASVDTSLVPVYNNADYPTLNIDVGDYNYQYYRVPKLGNAVLENKFVLDNSTALILFGEADLSSSAALNVLTLRVKGIIANPVIESTVSTDYQRLRETEINASINSEITIDAVKTATVDASTSSLSNITIDNTRLRLQSSEQSSDFAVSANGDVTLGIIANLAPDSNLNTRTRRFRDNIIDADAVASSLTVAVKTGRGLITLESSFNATITPVLTADTVTELTANLDIDADVVITAVAASTPDAIATLDSEVFRIQQTPISIASEASLEGDGDVRTEGNAEFASEFTLDESLIALRGFEIKLNTQAEIECDNVRARVPDLEFEVTAAELFASTKRLVRAEAALLSQGFVLQEGRVIQIDEFRTLVVSQETRTLTLPYENRTLEIDQETRKLTVWQQ